jgi:hypothetical protein
MIQLWNLFRESFQEKTIAFLWKEWTSLGIFGHESSHSKIVIDPESLLIFSLHVCRYEPRLFDEIIDWLKINGQFINVQRLHVIMKAYKFQSGPQLSAIAELLSENANLKPKWKKLASLHYQSPTAPLFYLKSNKPIPLNENYDDIFIHHGLKRLKLILKNKSAVFPPHTHPTLLLTLRALLGINARCELLILLGSQYEIHPTKAAKLLSYHQKTIQNALLEMRQSGVVICRPKGRLKLYSLKPNIMENLLCPQRIAPTWRHWSPFFKIMELIWDMTHSFLPKTNNPLLIASEFKKLSNLISPYIESLNAPHILANINNMNPEDFTKNFIKYILNQLDFLLSDDDF